MPHEGYVDPIMNDGPRFRSNAPVSELTERVTRAIETGNVSLAPPVAGTADGVMTTKMSRPLTRPPLCAGLEESWTRMETKCAVTEQWLRS